MAIVLLLLFLLFFFFLLLFLLLPYISRPLLGILDPVFGRSNYIAPAERAMLAFCRWKSLIVVRISSVLSDTSPTFCPLTMSRKLRRSPLLASSLRCWYSPYGSSSWCQQTDLGYSYSQLDDYAQYSMARSIYFPKKNLGGHVPWLSKELMAWSELWSTGAAKTGDLGYSICWYIDVPARCLNHGQIGINRENMTFGWGMKPKSPFQPVCVYPDGAKASIRPARCPILSHGRCNGWLAWTDDPEFAGEQEAGASDAATSDWLCKWWYLLPPLKYRGYWAGLLYLPITV